MLVRDHTRDMAFGGYSVREGSTDAAQAAERLLADIRELAPTLASRAAEFEQARRIPMDVVDTLRCIGVFRMVSPRRYGGLEFDLPTALKVVTTLSRIDGSLGWTVGIATGGAIFAGLLPRHVHQEVYHNGPAAILAGSAAPMGTAERLASGGWRVSGRWPFASGCQHADWLLAMCIMTENGKPIPGPGGDSGPPMMRGFARPAHEWQIEDTWHVAGLKGTGSHHIVMQDKVIPGDDFFDLVEGTPCEPGPLYEAVLPVLPLVHHAVAVGIAQGALDELIAMAHGGRQQLRAATPMRESELFQYELGRVAADVRAAHAVHQAQAASHWQHALAGTLRDEARYVESTQTGIWVSTNCVRAVDACFALGGGSALYETSPLQRRMRDIHAAAQHAAVQQRRYVDAGKLLLADTGST